MPSSYETEGLSIFLTRVCKLSLVRSINRLHGLLTMDGGQDTFSDKVFLLSRKEIFGDDEGVVTGEVVYPFWDGSSNADRIKGSPSYWWLRSPLVARMRVVITSGALTSHCVRCSVSPPLA